MSTVEARYLIETQYDAWGNGDPIPWAWAVVDDRDVVLQRGWAGSDAEAREHAHEWLDRYKTGDWNYDD